MSCGRERRNEKQGEWKQVGGKDRRKENGKMKTTSNIYKNAEQKWKLIAVVFINHTYVCV